MLNRALVLLAVVVGGLFLIGQFGGSAESGSSDGGVPLVPTSSTIDVGRLAADPQTHDEPLEAVDGQNGVVIPDLPGDRLDGVVITSNAAGEYPTEDFVRLAVDLVTAELTGIGQENYQWLANRLVAPCCDEVVFTTASVTFPADPADQASILLEYAAVDTNGDPLVSSVETFWVFDGNTWQSEFES